MIAETPPPAASKVNSLTAFARCRLAAILHSPSVRRESVIIAVLMGVLYIHPALTWWRRWVLPGGPQGYAVFVVPLFLAWLWVGRYRIVVPEADALFARFVDKDVLRFLMENEPEQPKRIYWLFWVGCVLSVATLWLREPSFTCLAFCITLLGFVGYRQGTFTLRVMVFPLLLLFTMIPLPGILVDWIFWRFQALFMGVACHIIEILGGSADRVSQANGIFVPKSAGLMEGYVMTAGDVGNGFWVAGLFLLLTLSALSIVDAPFRRKIACYLLAMLGVGFLIGLRLAAIGWLGVRDSGLALAAAGLTLPIMLAVAIVGEIAVMLLFRCAELRPWVRLGRDKAAAPDDAEKVPLYETPASVRSQTQRTLGITMILGVFIMAINLQQNLSPGLPTLPEHIDVWKEDFERPPDASAQRDHSPAVYRMYMSDVQPRVNVCVARATTLNDFRAGNHYLLGPDGLLLPNQEGSIPRKGDPHQIPVFTLQICAEHGEVTYLIHWIQAPGGDPMKDMTVATDKIGDMLIAHSRVFVCDAWISTMAGQMKIDYSSILSLFAERICKEIKQGS
jgi:hypothetical protein